MRKFFLKPLLTGLFALLPLVVTAALLAWMFNFFEHAARELILAILPENWEWLYFTGLGCILALLLAFGTGLLLQTWLARKLWSSLEDIFESLPLIKTIYNGVKDMLGFFSKSSDTETQQVVVVKSPDGAYRLLGFVTRTEFSDLPDAFSGGEADAVAVYLPMSYQLGGYTLMLPKSLIEPIDMSVEDALRFAVTAGVSQEEPDDPE